MTAYNHNMFIISWRQKGTLGEKMLLKGGGTP
nr:hypothetical protein SHINE37_44112 [Rhizobiaceae bacterium]